MAEDPVQYEAVQYEAVQHEAPAVSCIINLISVIKLIIYKAISGHACPEYNCR
jgi:hypothetical protein